MINVRPINRTDIPEIAKIEIECFSNPWSEKDIEDSFLRDCIFFVATEGEKIGGYLGIQISDGGYITNVAVSGAHRKKGMGEALMNKAIEHIKEQHLPFLTLEVRVSNAPAIALYEKMSMQNLGKRPRFYKDPPEDAYIYTLYF